jgi:hypothetical protein
LKIRRLLSVQNMAIALVIVTGLIIFFQNPPKANRQILLFEGLTPGNVYEVKPRYPYTSYYLYFQDEQNVEAFLMVDPNTGCQVNWLPEEGYFEEECQKIRYNLSGQPLENGDINGLNRYKYDFLTKEVEETYSGVVVYLNKIITDDSH